MDWNQDGEWDIISGDRDGYLNVFIRTGDSLTAYMQYTDTLGVPIDIGYNSEPNLFDWNGDGMRDLVTGEQSYEVRVYPNIGSDTWPMFDNANYFLVEAGGSPIYFYRVNPYLFDLNRDGRQDLLVGENNGYVHYFENQGPDTNPVFAAGETLKLEDGRPVRWTRTTYYYGSRCGFGDWNNDSIPDFLLSTYEGQIELYLGLAPTGVAEQRPRPVERFQVSPVPGGPPVRFSLGLNRSAELAVLDNAGRVVRALGSFEPGTADVTWDGRDDAGNRVPAGVYFCRLAAGDETRVGRVVLAR